MRVWIIKTGENIPFKDEVVRPMRAGLLAKMLVEKGHDVTWWTSSVNHFSKTIYPQSFQPEHTLPCGTKLIFLRSVLYKKNISFKRIVNHFGLASRFKKMAPHFPKPDIVICCFPTVELGYAVVKFCKKNNIPVLIDIRDLYPDVYINLFPSSLRTFAKIIFFPISSMVKKTMKGATGLTAISSTYLKWGLKFAQRSQHQSDGVFPLAYPIITDQISPNQKFTDQFKKFEKKKIVLYVGSFISSIDLETVISAARILQERHMDEFHFVLSGDGGFRKQWEAMAKGLHNITFTGWIDSHQIKWLAQRAWVGLGAYKKNALMSLPNKIFEYMSFGLPILLSLKGETRELLEKKRCGLYYESGHPESFIDCLEKLSSFPEERDKMAQSSLNTYLREYTPSLVYGNMIQHAIQVVEEHQQKHP